MGAGVVLLKPGISEVLFGHLVYFPGSVFASFS